MIAFESLPVGNTPAHLTPADGTRRAVIAVYDNSIRFTYDGDTAPSSTVGVVAEVGDIIELETLEQVEKFRANVGEVASPVVTATLLVHYENNDQGFREETIQE